VTINLADFVVRGKEQIATRLADFRKNAPKGRPMMGVPNIKYEGSDRDRAIAVGGIGVVHKLVDKIGLAAAINKSVPIFKIRNPYFESDHVLNIAYNAICGGDVLDDIELRRQDEVFLDAIGAPSIPDPTTAGDFCRRFRTETIDALMGVANDTRIAIWKSQPASFLKVARLDVDGIFVSTLGEKKTGMDINYKGGWGYHPLLVSLANTQEPLFIVNRPGNVPSHSGSADSIDKAIGVCREAGFEEVRVRGDTDFALTKNFDRWNANGTKFVFGIDSTELLVDLAEFLPEAAYAELVRQLPYEVKTAPRAKRNNVKDEVVKAREFTKMTLTGEQLTEFPYQPGACTEPYRIVALRKDISVTKGERTLLPEVRFFFYITNDQAKSMEEIVHEANDRCNQENLGAQLKGGVYALRAPLDTLEANWAFMVMTSMAWSLKAWLGLSLPAKSAEDQVARRDIVTMEFKRFVNSVILVPCQIVRSARQLIFRVLTWRPGIELLERLSVAMNC